jgi:hypothetical protein
MIVLPERRTDLLETMRGMFEPTRVERGCLSYRLYEDVEDRNILQSYDCASKERRREMIYSRVLSQKVILLSVLVVSGLTLLSGCATTQTWPDYERNAENKMVVIQEKIGDGLKTGALTPDQSQMFLTTLKGIRTDYTELRDRRVYRDEWDALLGRLDVLENEINRSLGRTTKIEEPRNGDRIVALQRRIDDGRMNRRWSLTEEREFQSRLDSIRRDYLRMTEGGRYSTYEERTDISRRLDALEADLNRSR